MPPMTTTGDISYRTAGYFSKQLLERSQPLLVLDKFGQPKPLPAHSTRTINWGIGIADLQGILGMLRLKSLLFGVVSVRM